MYQIGEAAYGNIQAAFAMAYAFGQLASGAWLDCIGTRLGLAFSLTFWSLASASHGAGPWLCRSPDLFYNRLALGFGFMRILLGVSESPCYPAAVKTLAEWFPKRERALAMGVVNAGPPGSRGETGAVDITSHIEI